MLMEFVDISVLNTSLPQIAFSLKINPIHLKIALTVYLLALGAFIPAAGWFSGRWGAKRVLTIAITGFLISSMACGLSTKLWMLTVARGFQGISGAFITPIARLMVIQLFKSRLAEVMNKIVPIFLLGPLIGPLVGGAITTQLNWRFIFFINVPVGLTVIGLIKRYFPSFTATENKPFDLLGFLLLASALSSTLFLFDILTLNSMTFIEKVGIVIVCLGLFVGYYWHYKKKVHAIINLAVFNNPCYRYFSGLLVTVRLFAMNMGFIGPLYVQTQYHYTAWTSGLLVTPIIIGALIAKRTLFFLQHHYRLKDGLSLLLGVMIIVELGLAYIMLHFTLVPYILLLILNGWCMGQLMPLIVQSTYRDLNKSLANVGSIINSAITQLSQGFAIALIAFMLIITAGGVPLDWQSALPKLSYAIVLWVSAGFLGLALISLRRWPAQLFLNEEKI